MEILDGSKSAEKWLEQLRGEILEQTTMSARAPNFEVIILGDDFASLKYVNKKSEVAKSIGINCTVTRLSTNIFETDLITKINSLNGNKEIDGIMLQLPLPDGIDKRKVLDAIVPAKDIDGLTSTNLGRVYHGDRNGLFSATPKGIMKLLEDYNLSVEGKDVVIVGKSDIVGLPLAGALLTKDATVQTLNIKSKDIVEKCSRADILISATGKAGLIDRSYVKEGAVVIDVGFSRDIVTGKSIGDVKFDEVKDKTSYITPVPGGVGPMTIAALMSNIIKVWKNDR